MPTLPPPVAPVALTAAALAAQQWLPWRERVLTARPMHTGRRAGAERARPPQAERALMCALLATALLDLLDHRRGAGARRRLAREWVEGCAALVTFEAVCMSLDLDAGRARVAILERVDASLVELGIALAAGG